MIRKLLFALFPLALISASCGQPAAGDSPRAVHKVEGQFKVTELGTFDEPWAMALLPGGSVLVTEKAGKLKLWSLASAPIDVLGIPKVDYGGQGGLGDVVLAPAFARENQVGDGSTIYLSWVEAGPGDTRGAVVARAFYDAGHLQPRLQDLTVIWRQDPKVTGRGHFSHRITFSPDGKYLFLASGERQKFTPAQDLSNNLGKVLRLNLDGTAAPGNPFAEKGGLSAQIWSYGHRNILGLQFAPDGRLWELEHGPAGGDELNLARPGGNYGWPLVSEGRHYDGTFIPHHAARPEFSAPAMYWNPVIAPGGMIFYTGDVWPEWRGQAIIAALGAGGLVRVQIDGDKASEVARYPLGNRIRAVAQAPDGALLVLEDGPGARLLRLSRK